MRDEQADEMLQAQHRRSGKREGKIYGEIVRDAFLRAFRHDRFNRSNSAVFNLGCRGALSSHVEIFARFDNENFKFEFFRNFLYTPKNFPFYSTPRI